MALPCDAFQYVVRRMLNNFVIEVAAFDGIGPYGLAAIQCARFRAFWRSAVIAIILFWYANRFWAGVRWVLLGSRPAPDRVRSRRMGGILNQSDVSSYRFH